MVGQYSFGFQNARPKAEVNNLYFLHFTLDHSSAPNNRADPNKRAGRKFQSLLI